jgi:hypothetical protein
MMCLHLIVLQVLMNVLTTNALTLLQKSSIVQMKQMLLFLLDAVSNTCSQTSGNIRKNVDEHMVAICRNVFPVSLVKLLLNEICEKVVLLF